MSRYTKPAFTEADLGRNPNIGTIVIPIKIKAIAGQYKKEEKDGESMVVPNLVKLEKTPITKVFTSPERRKTIAMLPPGPSKLWLWVQQELEYGKDYICINRDRYMAESGIKSINTYKDALGGLLRTGLLSLTLIPGVYWIDADMVFQGDRIKKYSAQTVVEEKPDDHE